MRLITIVLVIILIIIIFNFIFIYNKIRKFKTDEGLINNAYNDNLNKMYGGTGLNEWVIGFTLLPDDFVPELKQNNRSIRLMIEYSENWNRNHLIKTFLSAAQCFEKEDITQNVKIGYSVVTNRFMYLNSVKIQQNDFPNVCWVNQDTINTLTNRNRRSNYLGKRISVIDDRIQTEKYDLIDINFNGGDQNNSDLLATEIIDAKQIHNYNNGPAFYDLYDNNEPEMLRNNDTVLEVIDSRPNTITSTNQVYKYYDERESTLKTTKRKFIAINYDSAKDLIKTLIKPNNINNATNPRDTWENTRKLIKIAMDHYSFVFVFFNNNYRNVYIIGWNTLSQMNTVFNYILSGDYANITNRLESILSLEQDVSTLYNEMMKTINRYGLNGNISNSPNVFLQVMQQLIASQPTPQPTLQQTLQPTPQEIYKFVDESWGKITNNFTTICRHYRIPIIQNIDMNSIQTTLTNVKKMLTNVNINADTLKTQADNSLNRYLNRVNFNNVKTSVIKLRHFAVNNNVLIPQTVPSVVIRTSNHPNPDALFSITNSNNTISLTIDGITGIQTFGPFNYVSRTTSNSLIKPTQQGIISNRSSNLSSRSNSNNPDRRNALLSKVNGTNPLLKSTTPYKSINVQFFERMRGKIENDRNANMAIKNFCNKSKIHLTPPTPINFNNNNDIIFDNNGGWCLFRQPHITNFVLN